MATFFKKYKCKLLYLFCYFHFSLALVCLVHSKFAVALSVFLDHERGPQDKLIQVARDRSAAAVEKHRLESRGTNVRRRFTRIDRPHGFFRQVRRLIAVDFDNLVFNGVRKEFVSGHSFRFQVRNTT